MSRVKLGQIPPSREDKKLSKEEKIQLYLNYLNERTRGLKGIPKGELKREAD